jgi:hypothetical protein
MTPRRARHQWTEPADPFDTALAELKRIDRECREEHARFMAASRDAREAFDNAIAGLGS